LRFFERKVDVIYYREMQFANVQKACGVRFETPARAFSLK